MTSKADTKTTAAVTPFPLVSPVPPLMLTSLTEASWPSEPSFISMNDEKTLKKMWQQIYDAAEAWSAAQPSGTRVPAVGDVEVAPSNGNRKASDIYQTPLPTIRLECPKAPKR